MFHRLLKIFCLCCISVLLTVSCKEETLTLQKSPQIDADKAFSLLKAGAAIKPRHSGTEGAKKTVAFIADHIKELGYECQKDKWSENTPAGKIEFCNVIGEIPGKTDKLILVGCHFDGKKITYVPNFEGANDGASGVALLLSMMLAIKNAKMTPPATLKFVFFDGEECFNEYTPTDGLFGSRHLAMQMKESGMIKNCLAVVLLDMIGDRDLTITLPSGSDERLASQLLRIAGQQGVKQHFTRNETDIIDDHTPFQRQGIPVIDIIDFQFGKGNRYWHTSADTVDKTSAKSLQITGNATLQLLRDIPRLLKP